MRIEDWNVMTGLSGGIVGGFIGNIWAISYTSLKVNPTFNDLVVVAIGFLFLFIMAVGFMILSINKPEKLDNIGY